MTFRIVVAMAVLAGVSACGDDTLRGSSTKSNDGGTYLIVSDDNGGQCGPLLVDGKQWPYRIGERGPIAPGVHQIQCGTGSAFEVKQGTVFTFDYWGP